jgi:hypothetical protein
LIIITIIGGKHKIYQRHLIIFPKGKLHQLLKHSFVQEKIILELSEKQNGKPIFDGARG